MTISESIVPETPHVIRVNTAFGPFEVGAHQVLAFPSGVPGFEACRQWVLLSSPEFAPLSLLQSVVGPAASFLVVDPRRAMPKYRCVLSQADSLRLGASEDTELLWLATVAFEADGSAYVNLRAPLVINPERMLGYQVMPHSSLYPLRHPLSTV
jgi:flagellar assembly factor FliW